MTEDGSKGKFVTAKLKGHLDLRQGWVIAELPLLIQGESGAVYECESVLTEVINPPNKSHKLSAIM